MVSDMRLPLVEKRHLTNMCMSSPICTQRSLGEWPRQTYGLWPRIVESDISRERKGQAIGGRGDLGAATGEDGAQSSSGSKLSSVFGMWEWETHKTQPISVMRTDTGTSCAFRSNTIGGQKYIRSLRR